MISILQNDPVAYVLLAAILLWSMAMHELGHAYMAYRMGDPTARNMGRLTFNPLKHLDPMGSVLLLLFGFGWATTPVQPRNYRNLRQGMFWVGLAGVMVNALIALVVLILLALLGVHAKTVEDSVFLVPPETLRTGVGLSIYRALLWAVRINLALVLFNLMPVPPLDGATVLMSRAPDSWWPFLLRLQRSQWSIFGVLAVFYLFAGPIWRSIDSIILFALSGP